MEKSLFENRVVFLMNYRPDKLLSEQRMESLPGNPASGFAAKDKDERELQTAMKGAFDDLFVFVNLPPNDQKMKQLVLPKGSEIVYFQDKDNLLKFFGFDKWVNNQYWAEYVPTEEDLRNILPVGTLRSFKLYDGTSFRATLKRTSDKPVVYKFNWYFDQNGKPYNQSEQLEGFEIPKDYMEKEGGFWDKWGWIFMTAASVAAIMIFPGSLGLYLSLAIDMIPTVESVVKGNIPGAVISAILAFTSFGIAKIPGLGTITKEEAYSLAKKFANAKSKGEITRIYRGLSDPEKIKFQTIFNQDPQKLIKTLDNIQWQNLSQRLHTGSYSAKEMVSKLNELISVGAIKYPDAVKWWQKSGWKRFGVELGTTGFVVGSALAYGKIKSKQITNLAKRTGTGEYSDEERAEFMKSAGVKQ